MAIKAKTINRHYTPHGDHLIAGKRVSAEAKFPSAPGQRRRLSEISAGFPPELVAEACAAHMLPSLKFAATSREERAVLLDNHRREEIDARWRSDHRRSANRLKPACPDAPL